LVDKILRGTPPGDIPIEVDNHIHFALNLKAAQALGLTVPAEAIRRADRVIQ
jgi:putative ABC transport system substrate-binding protein